MAEVTGLSDAALVQELVDSGAYPDEQSARAVLVEGTRVVVKEGRVREISVRGKVYKAGGKARPSFEDFLNEGVAVFHRANFGLCTGESAGRDPADGYDSRYWEEEESVRGVIRARIPAWDAMDKLVKSIGQDVPKAGGGTTRWSFDCLEAAYILRLYAIWRTSTSDEFNSKYRPLRFGLHAQPKLGLARAIHCDGPGQPAYHMEGDFEGGVSMGGRVVMETRSMEQIVADAPVGSLVAFGSVHIQNQCSAGVPGAVCAFQFENTIKLGPDRYWAHPFGVITQRTIYQEMAKAAGATPSEKYYRDNLYISTVRYPE
jgi:hypothetical protein